VIADITDKGVLNYVAAAAAGENISIRYRSPWRHTEDKIYRGRIAQVHFSDGNLYLLFNEESGREFVLNAAFIKEYLVLKEPIAMSKRQEGGTKLGSDNWLEGFGIWAGEELQEIEVAILAPASRYYASQSWHEDQQDEWQDGEILVRRFQSIVSPELVRRILSLGRYVSSIKPEELREQVLNDAQALVKGLSLP
jgi:predicted DNA-binding transcriptional regulator YafY